MEQSDQATNIDHMAFQPTHSVLKTVNLWVLEITGVLDRAGISNEPVVNFTLSFIESTHARQHLCYGLSQRGPGVVHVQMIVSWVVPRTALA